MKEPRDSGFHDIMSQHSPTQMNDKYLILKEESETDRHTDGRAKLPFSVNTCHTNKNKEL